MRNLKYAHSFEVVADLPEPLQPLRKLAYNFRWTWHQETQQLFREADRSLWEEVEHNPVQLLNRLTQERQHRLSEDPVFQAKLRHCATALEEYLNAETWFDQKFPGQKEKITVAYFCAEFGLSECLPIYSGGLGILAGDHLKAASDLGVPLVAVGLLYSRGYFRQFLTPDGWQQEHYPEYDFYGMPLTLLRGEDGVPKRIEVETPDRAIKCQIWKAEVGRVPLYLLDSNILDNLPHDQSITDTLYGGDQEVRIRQELVLGIGGMRALRVLGIKPTVCHMNEGHSAFLTLERLRQFREEFNCDLRTARQAVVSGNVFTTHTPVPAGFDVFKPEMLEQYVAKSVASLDLKFDTFLKRGSVDEENPAEPFNMAIFAMEHANFVNGVSKLHAKVTREMFQQRWPDYPSEEVPVDAITNGIHTATWISRRMTELLDRTVGPAWREDPSDPDVWKHFVGAISDGELWDMRENQRGDFVRYVRRRIQTQMSRRNARMADVTGVSDILDPRVLTIGFARRFATYKRAGLLFSDVDRLKALLFHPERPVQFVFAGKSHPKDDSGKKLIQDIYNFIQSDGNRSRMVFLEDYDMELARMLVQGVDVWLNNPRRPLEASGTSGMKIVPNGGLNCSILDGWWAEGYKPGLGWAIGDETENVDQTFQDWLDSRALYHLIEQDLAPRFYHRADGGIPHSWIEMMKRSMQELAPRFSTARMVREYTARYYVPAAEAYLRLATDGLERAKSAIAWRDRVRTAWDRVSIQNVSHDVKTVNKLGEQFDVRVEVRLGDLSPDDVKVQTLFGQVGPNRELVHTEITDLKLVESKGDLHIFEAQLRCDRPGHRGYIVRIIPHHEDVRIPAELNLVRWETSWG